VIFFIFSCIHPPLSSSLFPYTTLFRSGQSLQHTILANGWPSEWFDLYAREQFHRYDPIPRHCLSTLNPFAWSEAPYDRNDEPGRSEEHTSELQSREKLVCRLLLEKKKK